MLLNVPVEGKLGRDPDPTNLGLGYSCVLLPTAPVTGNTLFMKSM
jgi:hypothetical protein